MSQITRHSPTNGSRWTDTPILDEFAEGRAMGSPQIDSKEEGRGSHGQLAIKSGKMIQALVLDYGGVLSLPQPANWYQVVGLRLSVAAEVFHAAYWQHRQAYDAGLPAEDYWTRVLATLGRSAQAAEVETLIESDVASWTRYRDEVWDVARSFRRLGGRIGFLSNGVPEVMARIRAERQLESCFDAVIVSCEVGVAKPDPRIYQMCLARLSVDVDRTLFVDDRVENLQEAAKLGMRTLHFASGDAIKQLTELASVPTGSTR